MGSCRHILWQRITQTKPALHSSAAIDWQSLSPSTVQTRPHYIRCDLIDLGWIYTSYNGVWVSFGCWLSVLESLRRCSAPGEESIAACSPLTRWLIGGGNLNLSLEEYDRTGIVRLFTKRILSCCRAARVSSIPTVKCWSRITSVKHVIVPRSQLVSWGRTLADVGLISVRSLSTGDSVSAAADCWSIITNLGHSHSLGLVPLLPPPP